MHLKVSGEGSDMIDVRRGAKAAIYVGLTASLLVGQCPTATIAEQIEAA